jgi:transposase
MPIQLQNNHSYKELKDLLSKNKDELMKTRIRILLLIKKGLLRKTIADQLSVHIDTIADVIRRYNKNGLESLKTNKGGRPEGNPKWDKQIFEDLKKEVNKQKEYWSIPKMVTWISTNKKQQIPETTVWYHMTSKTLNMSYKSARPHPQKGDRVKQEDFKKKDY